MASWPRPRLSRELRACSLRLPLCVHAAAGPRATVEASALLDATERAWGVATGALDLPPPDPSATTGSIDVYLVDGEPYATRTLFDRRDDVSGPGSYDRGSAFALVGRGVAGGCALDTAAARVVARAILFRVAPATAEPNALAESTSMANLMAPCSAPQRGAELATFQAHPELGLTGTFALPDDTFGTDDRGTLETPTPQAEAFARGGAWFYDWVDDRYGGYPGAIVRALWAETPTFTAPGAARWNDEPDGFDVLRTSFKGALTTGSTVDDLWLELAVARAFVPGYPVRADWSVDWPEHPRALLSASGVTPTGSAYVWVDCARRPPHARLRVEARWEEHAHFLWTLVRVDATGAVMSLVDVQGRQRGTEAQGSLVELDGVARVAIVGTNAGDPQVPVDPDDSPPEPHGWLLTIAAEP